MKHIFLIILLVGSIRQTLFNLRQQCDFEKEMHERFQKVRSRMKAEIEDYAEDMSFPMKPQKILSDVRETMDRGDILISDVRCPINYGLEGSSLHTNRILFSFPTDLQPWDLHFQVLLQPA